MYLQNAFVFQMVASSATDAATGQKVLLVALGSILAAVGTRTRLDVARGISVARGRWEKSDAGT